MFYENLRRGKVKKKIIHTTIFLIILLCISNIAFAKSENFGNWKYSAEENPIYEGIDLLIIGLSDKPDNIHVFQLELTAEGYYRLVFRRHEKLKEGSYELVYKFDDGNVYKGHWEQLSPHTFQFVAGFDKLKNFLSNMLNSKELYFGHRLQNQPMDTTTFLLDDFGLESINNE